MVSSMRCLTTPPPRSLRIMFFCFHELGLDPQRYSAVLPNNHAAYSMIGIVALCNVYSPRTASSSAVAAAAGVVRF